MIQEEMFTAGEVIYNRRLLSGESCLVTRMCTVGFRVSSACYHLEAYDGINAVSLSVIGTELTVDISAPYPWLYLGSVRALT